ncbi:DgyrCDS2395 [Dimorphilus gyrociliatus]|uniref:DgyrCDS2395 n=1 Tax=Dimorphilus gyrociliatus TaxID=2664684 RepID=A0A7I8VA59_9ANNE|nr:DgyrCDS2395 [Dimorphilus gyrociliatus]
MDDDLNALRQKRLAEMEANQRGFGGEGSEDAQRKMEMQKKQEDMKNSILNQVLDQNARARLNCIALTKPEKAKMVESMLCQMAQTGQIMGKLGEDQLKSLLEQVNQKTQKQTTVKFDRRRAAFDSDDEDY